MKEGNLIWCNEVRSNTHSMSYTVADSVVVDVLCSAYKAHTHTNTRTYTHLHWIIFNLLFILSDNFVPLTCGPKFSSRCHFLSLSLAHVA